jgi:glycosyltransferase involved in cell wall biosynthesis
MACGVPVTATNIEKVTESILIEPDIGKICYSDSPDEFAQVVISQQRESSGEKRAAASQRIRDHFDMKKIARTHLELYRSLLK